MFAGHFNYRYPITDSLKKENEETKHEIHKMSSVVFNLIKLRHKGYLINTHTASLAHVTKPNFLHTLSHLSIFH